jgi:hypothetical protein
MTMATAASVSRGCDLTERLYEGRAEANSALRPGARQLPVLQGLTANCLFNMPLENVLSATREILVGTGRVFEYGSSIVADVGQGHDRTLRYLVTDQRIEAGAAAWLSNLFICEIPARNEDAPPIQFPPPNRFVELLLNSEPTMAALPRIQLYANRPVFDQRFNFRPRGWHPEVRYLVHGPDVELALPDPARLTATCLRDRLPPHLHELFRDFCFKSDADLVNAVGALLTGMLVGVFVEDGKAINLLDGNRPSLGKTLFVRAMGIILDGVDPEPIRFTDDDDELEKKICATLRGNCKSALLIDNAKVRGGGAVNSVVIETNCTAPVVSLRILGRSANFVRPNDLVWSLTMNQTRTSADLLSRSLPIRFHYDGDPDLREFDERNPREYARRYRCEILGELAGMVAHWNQLGRQSGRQRHRLRYWAATIGGILDANSLPGFLSNHTEASSAFSAVADQLAALAESAFRTHPAMIQVTPTDDSNSENGATANGQNTLPSRANGQQTRMPF